MRFPDPVSRATTGAAQINGGEMLEELKKEGEKPESEQCRLR